jgi:hypothetical protein
LRSFQAENPALDIMGMTEAGERRRVAEGVKRISAALEAIVPAMAA